MTTPTPIAVLPHMRLSWGGTIGNPAVEQWSNTLAYRVSPEAASAPELVAVAAAAAVPLSAWISNGDAKISTAVRLKWVKAAWVLASGKQRDVDTAEFDLPGSGVSGGYDQPVIWEQTYAITLRTQFKRGPGHAGRIYPPVSGPGPADKDTPYASGPLINAMTQKFATCLTDLHTAINGAIPGTGRSAHVALVSRRTDTNPTPMLTDITALVIDRVADIQHRRVKQVARYEGTTIQIG